MYIYPIPILSGFFFENNHTFKKKFLKLCGFPVMNKTDADWTNINDNDIKISAGANGGPRS